MQPKRTDRSSSFPTSTNHLPANPLSLNPLPISHLPARQVTRLPQKKVKMAPINSRLTALVLTEFVKQGLKDVDIAKETGYSPGYIKNCRHAYGIFYNLSPHQEGGHTARPVRLCGEHSNWGRVAGATPVKCLAGQRYQDDERAGVPEAVWRMPRPETVVLTASSADWAVASSPEEEEFLADVATQRPYPPKPKR